jgi:hypothetical protein
VYCYCLSITGRLNKFENTRSRQQTVSKSRSEAEEKGFGQGCNGCEGVVKPPGCQVAGEKEMRGRDDDVRGNVSRRVAML